jgi:hypothetical protein
MMESWNNGNIKTGIREEWKNGRMEGWELKDKAFDPLLLIF